MKPMNETGARKLVSGDVIRPVSKTSQNQRWVVEGLRSDDCFVLSSRSPCEVRTASFMTVAKRYAKTEERQPTALGG